MTKYLYLGFAAAALTWAQAPDNTKTNQRDRTPGAVTADSQKETKADRELAQKIRKAINDDKTLSTYAHNAKVVVVNGQVTLKGPVRTEAEKEALETKAVLEAGKGNVVNQLDIAPEKK